MRDLWYIHAVCHDPRPSPFRLQLQLEKRGGGTGGMSCAATFLFRDTFFAPAKHARRLEADTPPAYAEGPAWEDGQRLPPLSRWAADAAGAPPEAADDKVDQRAPARPPGEGSSASLRSRRAAAVIAKYGKEAVERWDQAHRPPPPRALPQQLGSLPVFGDRSQDPAAPAAPPGALDCRLIQEAFPVRLRGDDTLAAEAEGRRAALARGRRRHWAETAAQQREATRLREELRELPRGSGAGLAALPPGPCRKHSVVAPMTLGRLPLGSTRGAARRPPTHAEDEAAGPPEPPARRSAGADRERPPPGSPRASGAGGAAGHQPVPTRPDSPASSCGGGRHRGTALSLLPHKTTVQDRFRKLRHLVRTRRPAESWLEQAIARQSSTAALTWEQKEHAQETLARYAAERAGPLTPIDVRFALEDLGYRPRTRREKQRLVEMLEETLAAGDMCVAQLQEFVCEVMCTFHSEMFPELEEHFRSHDRDHSGTLAEVQARSILREMALDPRNAEERKLVDACFPSKSKELAEKAPESKPEPRAGNKGEARASSSQEAPTSPPARAPGKRLTLVELGEAIDKSQVIKCNMPRIGFMDFETTATQVREGLVRLRRRRFLKVKDEFRIAPETAVLLSDELCDLKDAFDALDVARRRKLTLRETQAILADVGIYAQSAARHQALQAVIAAYADGGGDIAFGAFLNLLMRLREMLRADRWRALKSAFCKADTGSTGYLSVQACSKLLADLGMSPRSLEQQRAISRIFDVVDQDGAGRYSLEAFEVVFMRVDEMAQRCRRQEECDMAVVLDISKVDVEEYRDSFHTFDDDDSGALSVEEVRRLVDVLHLNVSGDLLNDMVGQVDLDGSGTVQFHEFLQLMCLVAKRLRPSAPPAPRSLSAES